MRKLFVLALITMGFLVSCEIAETDTNTDVEDAIMRAIAADDSTYGLDGLGDIDEEYYSLGKAVSEAQLSLEAIELTSLDSNYVWSFGRRGMEVEREVIVEVENDSAAQALISHHMTGTFIVRQFDRVWTGERTWDRGDSVRFSEKPIDMTTHRRVAFRKRVNDAGEEQWIPTAMTLLSGRAGSTLDIEALEWIAEDSTMVLSDFDTEYYSRRQPLVLSRSGVNQVNIIVSNDVEGEAEQVIGRLGYNPRMSRPDARSRFHSYYTETLENGDKVYVQRVAPIRQHHRHFKGFVEAIDYRTLFDHDYVEYASATLGFIYTTRERVRP